MNLQLKEEITPSSPISEEELRVTNMYCHFSPNSMLQGSQGDLTRAGTHNKNDVINPPTPMIEEEVSTMV